MEITPEPTSEKVIQKARELMRMARTTKHNSCLLAGSTLGCDPEETALSRAAALFSISRGWAEPDISKHIFTLTWSGIEYLETLNRRANEDAIEKCIFEILEKAEKNDWKFVWIKDRQIVQFPQERLGEENGTESRYGEAAMRMYYDSEMIVHLADNWYRVTEKGRTRLFGATQLSSEIRETPAAKGENNLTKDEKKFQVFVSSTFEDLRDERVAVYEALLRIECIPTGMEGFSAGNDEAWDVISKCIDCCDYLVVIVANRYGSLSSTGTSFTEREYRYALEKNIPVAAFLLDEKAHWPSHFSDPQNHDKLKEFRQLAKRKLVRSWNTASELAKEVSISIPTLIKNNPRPGWIRVLDGADN